MVTFNIDNRELSVSEGTTILRAAEQAGIPIPHLCFLKDINEIAACRLCIVEVDGTDRLVPACDTAVVEGMRVRTNSPRVRQARKTNLRLILSQHECREPLPRAAAVVDPHRSDCPYPFKCLAGVGVALNLVLALGGESREDSLFARYCALAAIGTIADVMRMPGGFSPISGRRSSTTRGIPWPWAD